MTHNKEFQTLRTIDGWTEEEANKNGPWNVRLKFRDVHRKTTLVEKVTIKIGDLMISKGIDVDEDEITETARQVVLAIRRARHD